MILRDGFKNAKRRDCALRNEVYKLDMRAKVEEFLAWELRSLSNASSTTPAWLNELRTCLVRLWTCERAKREERLWGELFKEPGTWWDNRRNKRSSNFPDFKHAYTGEALWLDSQYCPEWLSSKLTLLEEPNDTSGGRGLRARYKKTVEAPKHEQVDEQEALRVYHEARKTGKWLTSAVVISALKACGSLKDLETGRSIHAALRRLGKDTSSVFLASALVDMYGRCGSMIEARDVFERMVRRDSAAWNCIISRYAESGEAETALELFERMQLEKTCKPNHVTHLAVLKACSRLAEKEDSHGGMKRKSLRKGKEIHLHVTQGGRPLHRFVVNALVDLYTKCGNFEDARRVFDGAVAKDTVTWNCFISRCAEAGEGKLALRYYSLMQEEDVPVNYVTILAALKACVCLAEQELGSLVEWKVVKADALCTGRELHAQAVSIGSESHTFVASSLVDMYSKCGSLDEARTVFEKIASRSVVSWTSIINGYAENGEPEEALRLFSRMQDEGREPDTLTYVAVLKACVKAAEREAGEVVGGRLVKTRSLEKGKAIHSGAERSRLAGHLYVACTLVDMYSKCGSLADAREVFETMQERNAVAWNCIISGCSEGGEGEMAFQFYERMKRTGKCSPNDATFLAVLKACVSLAEKEDATPIDGLWRPVKLLSLRRARAVHAEAVAASPTGKLHLFVASSLVDLYAKCGSMVEARKVFDGMPDHNSLVPWTSLILGYSDSGEGKLAMELYLRMREQGCQPDAVAYVAALKACVSLAEKEEFRLVDGKMVKANALEIGKAVYSQAVKSGFKSSVYVASSVVDMYCKCGSMAQAREVFDGMVQRDVVTWNSIIQGHSENGECEEAIKLFERMKNTGFKPDGVTYVAVLKACGSLGALETGRQVEVEIREAGPMQNGELVENTLVDVYGKCGSMSDAQRVFNSVRNRDVVSWNALIDGYSRQGDVKRVLGLLDCMQRERIKPDEITLLSVLSSFSHAGAVDEGKECFETMSGLYRISPGVKHYSCMIDMLGRANRLDEAVEMVSSMPSEANSDALWTALLGAARKWKNLKVGRLAFDKLLGSQAGNSSTFALMSNLYAGF